MVDCLPFRRTIVTSRWDGDGDRFISMGVGLAGTWGGGCSRGQRCYTSKGCVGGIRVVDVSSTAESSTNATRGICSRPGRSKKELGLKKGNISRYDIPFSNRIVTPISFLSSRVLHKNTFYWAMWEFITIQRKILYKGYTVKHLRRQRKQ